MSIAYRVQDYIAEHDLAWDAVPHRGSQTSRETARLAHVLPDRVAKAVILEDRYGYVLAVIGADRRLDVSALDAALRRDLRLASESELRTLFSDCAPGAVPPVGPAYGVTTVWDESLGEKPDVYFEGGDHHTLVHMSGADFCELMRSAQPLHRRHH
jgi:Ala-tRNA(Pro) deacylase